jgi:NAD(P)-dependent dehydrogenase (short-subunit alcohol dehydrogenase family)
MACLNGKVAFLTGGGAGIAKCSALEFVKEGAQVAIVDINAEVGKRAEQEIKAAGGDVIFMQADVTQDAQVQQAIDTAVAKFGKLNVLVNCAGGSVLEETCRCMK